MNILKRGVEEVAQETYGAAGFFINLRRILGGFLYFYPRIFAMLNQDSKLSVEFGYAFAFGYRADDDTEVFRLDAHQQLFRRARSSLDLIFCDTETLSLKGISTRYRCV